jgi:hypothetical protein
MKKIIGIIIFCFAFVSSALSQTPSGQNKQIAEIFTDFHYYINDTTRISGFALNRAYLGYNLQIDENFSSAVIVNVGNPEELVPGAKQRRYGYFREASVKYAHDNLNIAFGMVSTRIFDFQQRFWGKRYVANEYQSAFGYGSVADLGVVADYKLNEVFKVDVSILNGNGYSNLQIDNHLKTAFGITITPGNHLSIRLYTDLMKPLGVLQNTLIGFVGFRNDLFYIGAEASYKSNLDITEGHHGWGLSSTAAVKVVKNTEIFARYDYATSNIPNGEVTNWNYSKDGRFGVFGIQYTFNPIVQMALNYQGNFPYDDSKKNTDAIFLNVHLKF